MNQFYWAKEIEDVRNLSTRFRSFFHAIFIKKSPFGFLVAGIFQDTLLTKVVHSTTQKHTIGRRRRASRW